MTALFPLACILAIAFVWLLATLHTRLDALRATYRIGRELLDAAGSKREARLAIESVRLERALARKFGAEFVRKTAAPSKPNNVVRLEIKRGGRALSFPPSGDAA